MNSKNILKNHAHFSFMKKNVQVFFSPVPRKLWLMYTFVHQIVQCHEVPSLIRPKILCIVNELKLWLRLPFCESTYHHPDDGLWHWGWRLMYRWAAPKRVCDRNSLAKKKWQGIVVDFDLQYLWMVTMFGKLLLNSLDIFAKVNFARFAEYGTDRT